ncbi:MAG: hypothetical protein ABIQ86_15135 [Steroidobacteraceae bacterium]
MGRFYLLSIGLYAAQLLWLGHWLMAVVMLLLAAATVLALRQMVPAGPAAPRRLLLAADGRLHIARIDGRVEQVELAGESLWLGSAVLLVLDAPGRRHRLLVGRGNVEPAALATLRRRLRGAASVPGDPALDSGANPRQGASAVEHFIRGNPT